MSVKQRKNKKRIDELSLELILKNAIIDRLLIAIERQGMDVPVDLIPILNKLYEKDIKTA